MRIEIGTNEKMNIPKFVQARSAYDSAIIRTLLILHIIIFGKNHKPRGGALLLIMTPRSN